MVMGRLAVPLARPVRQRNGAPGWTRVRNGGKDAGVHRFRMYDDDGELYVAGGQYHLVHQPCAEERQLRNSVRACRRR